MDELTPRQRQVLHFIQEALCRARHAAHARRNR